MSESAEQTPESILDAEKLSIVEIEGTIEQLRGLEKHPGMALHRPSAVYAGDDRGRISGYVTKDALIELLSTDCTIRVLVDEEALEARWSRLARQTDFGEQSGVVEISGPIAVLRELTAVPGLQLQPESVSRSDEDFWKIRATANAEALEEIEAIESLEIEVVVDAARMAKYWDEFFEDTDDFEEA